MTDHEGIPQKLTEREAEVYELTAMRQWTQQRIADRLGISQPRVSQILADIRKKLPPPDLAEIRQRAVDMHLGIIESAYSLAEMDGVPVTAGKDGDLVRDPATNQVVRDFRGRVEAHRLALQSMKELRTLLGLDAAGKLESTSVVKYIVEGVDTEDLK